MFILLLVVLSAVTGMAAPDRSAPYEQVGPDAVSNIPVGAEPKSIATGDFNGDGRIDLAVANRSGGTVSILIGDGSGGFGAATNFPAGLDPYGLVVGDFNNDGKEDLIVANGSFDFGKLSILLGNGAGGFGAPTSFTVGGTPNSITVGDFNRDGNKDLAVANAGFDNTNKDNVLILLGTGAGSFSAPVSYPAGTRPAFIAVGDFNKDGKSDLAVADIGFGFNKISILTGDGVGGFSAPVNIAVGASPAGIATGDFDKDGNLDLAVANTDSSNVSILLGNGAGGFGAATNLPANSSFPYSIVAGDFNNDGNTDLAIGPNDTRFNTISILLGDGRGGFGRSAMFTAGTGPNVLAVGDFNRDGVADLAVANAQSNDVSILLNPPPTASVSGASVVEGDGGTKAASFTVTLSAASDKSIRFSYAVTAGTAAAGTDFDGTPGLLTIPAGSTTGVITVPVFGDTTFEPDETFFVDLSSPLNAFIDQGHGQGTIVNDDPLPAISISDTSLSEGDSGTKSATFTVSLSNASYQTIAVNFATADGTATAGSDYVAKSGALTFSPGQTVKSVTVLINGDTTVEPDETFFVNLSGATNATISKAQGSCTIKNDDAVAQLPAVQFSSAAFNASEDDTENTPRATVTVTRSGDTSGASSVTYSTVDDTRAIRCDDTTTTPGVAFARCDYATVVGTLTFAPGETQKTFTVPIVDDTFVEPTEAFGVRLSNPSGATLGPQSAATVSIRDNDIAGEPNALNGTDFFVRQQYLDFLSREPEAGQPWSSVLNNCKAGDITCDRVAVSANFFRSQEFQLKGLFVFRFYKAAFGRLPTYAEIVADMASVTGSSTPDLIARKAAWTAAFAQRQDFASAYGPMTNQQFVDALMGRYSLQSVTTPDPADPDGQAKVALSRADLVARLNAATLTRAQVLRAVADSDQVSAAEFNAAFVAMQYFGYLRRDPEPQGYANWLATINANPSDFRSMVNGFVNSTEYRLRFGQP